jgi:alpha-glucosidase
VSDALPWWKTDVVYQVYPRSFADANGDGIGDLPGITAKLEYLVDLGVGAVWLSPFYPSPMADFGYDVSDYCDVDPMFGTLADADALIETAHRLGLRVIIDWVPNHTSNEHPWFLEAAADPSSAKRDWYVFRPAKPADEHGDPSERGARPNNWVSHFGGPAWTWHEPSGEYYLHSFLAEQPDLNWRNPELRSAMFDVLRFWLDRGVDGFRIDVAASILKDPELRDNPLIDQDWRTAGFFKDLGAYGRQDHIHDGRHEDTHDVFAEIRALLDSYEAADGRPRYAIGEIHEAKVERWAGWHGTPDHPELHQSFNFALLRTPWTPEALTALAASIEEACATAPWVWPNWVLSNHDEHRSATRVGVEQARNVIMLLLTLRGTPTLYYGEELGLTNVDIPEELQQDPWAHGASGLGLGRDPERTPMVWTDGPNAGFSFDHTNATPWLPIGDDNASRNVAGQRNDPTSFLSFSKAMLALRRKHRALHAGSWSPLPAPGGVLAYERADGGDRFVVLLELTGRTTPVALPEGMWTCELTTEAMTPGDASGVVVLPANSGAVFRRID